MLIEPLEADGTLVRRGREKLEAEIGQFTVIEHDGVIAGCAALYPFLRESCAEMACFVVSPEYRGTTTASDSCRAWSQGAPDAHQAPVRAHHAHGALVHRARLHRGATRTKLPRPSRTQLPATVEDLLKKL